MIRAGGIGLAMLLALSACGGGEQAATDKAADAAGKTAPKPVEKAKPDAPTPVEPGLYGNVGMSEETGDLGGIELEVSTDAAQPYVQMVLCEGWCNDVYTAPISWTEDGFTFSYQDRGIPKPVPMRVRRRGKDVTITAEFESGEEQYRLKALEQPFGLSVAREGTFVHPPIGE